MGNTYTRQSSYSDGDVITAAHTNDEFNQLLAAFQASSGHTHDGTANEGGPITKMLGTSLTLGDGTAGTDITVTFDGETSDGVLKWMEDEDYFEFSDDILVASTEKLQFRDTAIYINSSTDGQLDIVADTEVQIAATTIDINGNVDISGTVTIGSAEISETELEVLDGLTVSTTEVNILDGDTTASSTTLADADRVVVNDAGTMKQVALTDFETYFESALDTLSNVTTVGALNSGSITSGFGTIDTGSSTITTTGLITGGSLDIDDVLINGSNIGHTDDTDLITLANGVVTVAGELDATTLDISGNADIDGTLEADAITVNGTALDEFISDTVGAMVGSNTETGVAVSYDDSDNTLDFVLGTAQTTIESVKNTSLVVGRDDDNLIKFSTDNQIIFEVSGGDNVIFKASGEIEASSLDISGDVDVDGTLEADAITVNGSALATVIAGTTVANATLAATATVTDSTANTNFPVVFHDESNALLDDTGALRYNPSSGTLLVPNLTVSGTTTTVSTTNTTVSDNLLELNSGAGSNANDVGIIIERGSTGNDALFIWDESEDKFALGTTTSNASSTGNLNMTTGTLVANVEGNITGNLTGTASTATVATTVTISDNESTDEDNAIIFTAGGDVDGGNIGLESDGDLTYNPSTGRLTATQLSGTLQTAAQANVTSLGTLTTLTVDNVIINGSTIGHTGDTDLMTVASGVLTVAGEVDATSLDISGDADIDGTLEADAITVNGTALNTVIADESTALAIALG